MLLPQALLTQESYTHDEAPPPTRKRSEPKRATAKAPEPEPPKPEPPEPEPEPEPEPPEQKKPEPEPEQQKPKLPTPDEAEDNAIVVPVRGADDEFRRVMNTWTVKDMRAALKDAGQAHAGNKSELAERLVAHGLHGQRADDIQLIES